MTKISGPDSNHSPFVPKVSESNFSPRLETSVLNQTLRKLWWIF